MEVRRLPRHIAFIMDGNGRWARQQGLERTAGHRHGTEQAREVLEACREWGIHWVTLYAFSTENWKRPEEEVDTLFHLMVEFIDAELDRFLREGVRLHLLGDPADLPAYAREPLLGAIERTQANDTHHVQVCINYGGRDEILRAVRRWASDPDGPGAERLAPADFARYLDSPEAPDPDLMVRTSGEQRISNFLLWELAYAELVFVEAPWPDFGRDGLRAALETYAARTRRFGRTDEQIEETREP
jgi:undecaprenyl diphosphate synthase